MGYYTSYMFTDVEGPSQDFFHQLAEISGYGRFCLNWDSREMKWYDHDSDVVAAMFLSGCSRVELHGEGEEQGDVWDKVYSVAEDGSIKLERYQLEQRRSADPQVTTFAKPRKEDT